MITEEGAENKKVCVRYTCDDCGKYMEIVARDHTSADETVRGQGWLVGTENCKCEDCQ